MGQPIGSIYASLAPTVPPVWSTPFKRAAENKLSEAFLRSVQYYKEHGEEQLVPFIQRQLDDAEAYLQKLMDRNVLAAE